MKSKHANVALFVPHAGCPHQCSFCNQKAISGKSTPLTPQAVKAACDRAEETMPSAVEKAEIAFFGGSFTAVPRDYQEALLTAAFPYIQRGVFGGIRLSTRPDAIDPEELRFLKSFGVTAIELGAQSMDDAVLRQNGRGHTAGQVEEASALIHDAGFSLGLQMMTGLPGDSPDGARETAHRLAALSPDTIRIYPTQVMADTPLAARLVDGTYIPPTLVETVALCAELLLFFEEEHDIPVIRLGLHAEEDMMRHRLAGPWHPAFRELCEGEIYLRRAREALRDVSPGAVTLAVNVRAVSPMIGQKRRNRAALAAEGYRISVFADAAVPRYQVLVKGT